MKILFLSHFIPFPPTGGASLRNFNLIKSLGRDHSVHLVTFTQNNRHRTHDRVAECTRAVAEFVDEVHVVPVPSDRSRLRWYLLLSTNLLSPIPYSVSRFSSPEFTNAVSKQLENQTFDVVHIDTIALAAHTSLIEHSPVVLNHHNIESSLLLRRAKSLRNPFSRAYLRHQGEKLRSYERRLSALVAANTTVSELDREELLRISPDAQVGVVANGTDPDFFHPETGASETPRLVFAGSLQWYPNAEAMSWFARDIWPRIRAAVPNVQMDLIGSHPPKQLIDLSERDPAFRVLGFVDDVRPVIDAASVYVVPIRVGGGTRLKILDAMAMGKPIVSHSIGAEGLDIVADRDLVLADDPITFAQAVIDLLKDRERAASLGRAARKRAVERYTWDQIVVSLVNLYESVSKRGNPQQ